MTAAHQNHWKFVTNADTWDQLGRFGLRRDILKFPRWFSCIALAEPVGIVHPLLHIRITWRFQKNPDGQTVFHTG